MLSTNFKELAEMYVGERTNEGYKDWFDNKEKDVVIAYLYTTNYYLFKQSTEGYLGLDEHTIEDIILTQIWRCLDQYDADKSKGKITTFICKYIRFACRNATEAQSSNKTKINQRHISSLFCEFDKPEDLDKSQLDNNYSDVEMREYLKQLNLTTNQYNYCKIILDNKSEVRMADIARELGISRAGVLGIKRQLQQILQDLIA